MTLKTVDMESCTPKRRCLGGDNTGLAYTPGDECEDGYTFNDASCDCDVECPQCSLGDPSDVQLCSWAWTDERGLNFGLSSYGPPMISEPRDCGSTFCYFDVSGRACDGTYGTPTFQIGYCNGSGCADDGIQLTGPVATSCNSNNTCSDVLCPGDNEVFNCDTCSCDTLRYWQYKSVYTETVAYYTSASGCGIGGDFTGNDTDPRYSWVPTVAGSETPGLFLTVEARYKETDCGGVYYEIWVVRNVGDDEEFLEYKNYNPLQGFYGVAEGSVTWEVV